jgi:predicted nucleotidyltransferase component of viral defense system
MNREIFHKQAELLISILPQMTRGTDFALHGGTAINFFVRNMPRLSVDIDLTYLPISPREETIRSITEQLKLVSKNITKSMPDIVVEEKKEASTGSVTKLFVRRQNAVVKIEPNLIIRGSLFECEERELCERAEEVFERSVAIKTLSFSDLYGSKICAALDRQHPRDIFDIMLLFRNEGITDQVRKAFLVYLISHNRPMSELLEPNLKDMKPVFEKEFEGMASINVEYEELVSARKTLIEEINRRLTEKERDFLVSFKEMAPKWDLLGVDGAQDMPAVRWKLANLAKMKDDSHKRAVHRLKDIIEKAR